MQGYTNATNWYKNGSIRGVTFATFVTFFRSTKHLFSHNIKSLRNMEILKNAKAVTFVTFVAFLLLSRQMQKESECKKRASVNTCPCKCKLCLVGTAQQCYFASIAIQFVRSFQKERQILELRMVDHSFDGF